MKKKVEKERLSYQDVIQRLNQAVLIFKRKAGEKDMIFGAVSAADIKEELDRQGFEIEKKKIILDEPLRRLGNYTITVKVYHDDKASLKVEVRKEETGAEEAESKPVAGE